MKAFTLECLKEAKALQVVCVPVPEFGADVACYVAEMSAEEQDERLGVPWGKRRERLGLEDGDNSGFRSFAVAASLCDESRNWLAPKVADINDACDQLAGKSAKAITRLFAVAAQINGIGDLAVEEVEKN